MNVFFTIICIILFATPTGWAIGGQFGDIGILLAIPVGFLIGQGVCSLFLY